MKQCNVCLESFPLTLSYFRKHQNGIGGFAALCKKCNKARDRAAYHKYKAIPSSHVNLYRKYADGYNTYLVRVYNQHKLREQDLRNLMDKQKGCCKICGASLVNPIFSKSSMHIDHCHATGRVRGLLCCNCNHLLGVAFEREDLLINATQYLKEYHG